MNLHSIVAPLVSAVNPMVPCSVQVSLGSAVDTSYNRVPAYAAAVTIEGQVQSLTFRDLQQMEGLNLQGTRRAIYLLGDVEGLVRVDNKGGDLITLPDNTVWLVAMVLESWLQNNPATDPGWVKVAVTLQNGA